MIKKIFCLLIFVIFFTCGCTGRKDDLGIITKRGKIIVGVRTDTKPFGYKDINGTLQGYDIELAHLIAKAVLGSDTAVEFVPVTAENRVEKLNSKEVDILIATMSVTNQRQLVVDFSEPYYAAGQALMVKNNNTRINSLRNLNGKRVIIVYGSTGEESIKRNVPEAIVIGFKTYTDAINALVNGKADALIADDTVLLNYVESHASVKLLPNRYSHEPYAIAFRKDENSKRVQTRINFTIQNLKAMGVLRRMEEKWGVKHK